MRKDNEMELDPFFFIKIKGTVHIHRAWYATTQEANWAAYEANRIFGVFTRVRHNTRPRVKFVRTKYGWRYHSLIAEVLIPAQKAFSA